jgi:hypothetical protein
VLTSNFRQTDTIVFYALAGQAVEIAIENTSPSSRVSFLGSSGFTATVGAKVCPLYILICRFLIEFRLSRSLVRHLVLPLLTSEANVSLSLTKRPPAHSGLHVLLMGALVARITTSRQTFRPSLSRALIFSVMRQRKVPFST